MKELLPFLFIPLSLLLLAGAVVLTIHWFRREKYSGFNLLSITLLVVLSVTALRMPLYLHQGENGLASFFHGVISGLQTVGLDEDLGTAIEHGVCIIDGVDPSSLNGLNLRNFSIRANIYAAFVIFQCITGIVLCGFALIQTLTSVLLKILLRIYRQPVFFFSHLTEGSILLARSIQESMKDSGQRCLMCFTSVPEEIDQELEAAWEKAELKNTVRLRGHLTCRLFSHLSPSINCILCHENEQENLKALHSLLEESRSAGDFHRRRSLKYFVFAQSRQAEFVIDQMLSADKNPGTDKNSTRIICMLNPKENLAVHILNETPLHKYIAQDEKGNRHLNVLIAGSTPLADRFLRNAYACGQMHDCRLSITLAATDAEEARQQLLASAPLLASPDHPIVQECGPIRFHTLPHNDAIADEALLKDAQYILLAYDSDEENIKAARRICTIIDRQKLIDADRARQNVAIVYVVEDMTMHGISAAIDKADPGMLENPCEMIPVGNRETQNHTDVLFGHELLRKAFFLEKAYEGVLTPEEIKKDIPQLQKNFVSFMNTAYNRRSSVSAALHLQYRSDALKNAADPQTMEAKLTCAEHRRWNAYTIMSGYMPPTGEQLESYLFKGNATHKCDELLLHPCLTPSKPAFTPDLWKPGTQPVDKLDALSLRLHAMLLDRLRQDYPALRKLLHNPGPEDKAAIKQEAAKLADERALRMSKKLFTDYKQYDLDIIRHTDAILRQAEDQDILAALRLFWMEAD